MYDYKFRQNDLSVNKPKRTLNRKVLGISGLAVAAASVYGIVQLNFPWQAQTDVPETDSDIIPLALPPHAEPEERTQPADTDLSRPAENPSDQAFTDTTDLSQARVSTAALSTPKKTLAGTEGVSVEKYQVAAASD